MDNHIEVSDMPPLTDHFHAELRVLEGILIRHLNGCCGYSGLVDPNAAFEYARTFGVKFYDCFFDFYSKSQNPAYRPHCRPASEKFALQRVEKCLSNSRSFDTFLAQHDRHRRLKKTISEHADLRDSGLTATAEPKTTKNDGASLISTTLGVLKKETHLSAQKIADGIEIDLRSVQRHLSGDAVPRGSQIAAYEEFFSKKLGRAIKLETP
jgi:hypothetical protein